MRSYIRVSHTDLFQCPQPSYCLPLLHVGHPNYNMYRVSQQDNEKRLRDHNESLDFIPVSPVYTDCRRRGRSGVRQQTGKKDEDSSIIALLLRALNAVRLAISIRGLCSSQGIDRGWIQIPRKNKSDFLQGVTTLSIRK